MNPPARNYEPLWSAIEDTGMVLAFHAFTNSEDTCPEDWGEEDRYKIVCGNAARIYGFDA